MDQQNPNNPTLASLAKFNYQGLTLEQLLVVLATKNDEIIRNLQHMDTNVNSLKEQKADRAELAELRTKVTTLDAKVDESEVKLDENKEKVTDEITKLKLSRAQFVGIMIGVSGAISAIVSWIPQLFNLVSKQ